MDDVDPCEGYTETERHCDSSCNDCCDYCDVSSSSNYGKYKCDCSGSCDCNNTPTPSGGTCDDVCYADCEDAYHSCYDCVTGNTACGYAGYSVSDCQDEEQDCRDYCDETYDERNAGCDKVHIVKWGE